MLVRNIELGIKAWCIKIGSFQREADKKVDVPLSCVKRIVRDRGQIVNRTFVKMMDGPGCDVKLT